MTDVDYTKTDHNGLPVGPWTDEPDLAVFMHCELVCVIRRADQMGHLCGYVVLPPDEVLNVRPSVREFEDKLDVHGGITYSDVFGQLIPPEKLADLDPSIKIPGADQLVVGFDCGHSVDMTPAMNMDGYTTMDVKLYRDFNYVTEQTKSLAEQVWDCILGHVVGD